MEITTKRLTIRPIRTGDEKEIHEYAGDKSITMMYFLPNETFEETEEFVKKNAEAWKSADQTNFEFVTHTSHMNNVDRTLKTLQKP